MRKREIEAPPKKKSGRKSSASWWIKKQWRMSENRKE